MMFLEPNSFTPVYKLYYVSLELPTLHPNWTRLDEAYRRAALFPVISRQRFICQMDLIFPGHLVIAAALHCLALPQSVSKPAA